MTSHTDFLDEYAQAIVENMREPLLALSADLRVLVANSAFYKTFGVSPEEVENCPLYELGDGAWDIPRLRVLLEEVLPQNTHFHDFKVDHEFSHIGRNTMLLNARRLCRDADPLEMILFVLEDVTERKLAEEALTRLHGELEARVQERTAELAQAVEALRKDAIERVHAEEKQTVLVVEERTRISRDIHDTLAQEFTGIIIQLEVAEDALGDDPETARASPPGAGESCRSSPLRVGLASGCFRSARPGQQYCLPRKQAHLRVADLHRVHQPWKPSYAHATQKTRDVVMT